MVGNATAKSGIRVLSVVDGPNSTGMDLNAFSRHSYEIDHNCSLIFTAKLFNPTPDPRFGRAFDPLGHYEKFYGLIMTAESNGYRVLLTTKDVDILVLSTLDQSMESRNPPNKIIIGAGDRDYSEKVKDLRKKYPVEIAIAIGTIGPRPYISSLYTKLGVEILSFPLRQSKVEKYYKRNNGDEQFCPKCGEIFSTLGGHDCSS